jgi:chemotaxis protein methyltransferase CheR
VDEFRLFHSLIYKECGMYLKESRQDFLEVRLRKRLKACRIPTIYHYYRFLQSGPDGQRELLALLDLLTINETYFYRNRPQFALFETKLLPDLIARRNAEGQKRLRIWSAGCSTGEEPYSIAMAVLDALRDAGSWEIKIYASDLSLRVLEQARSGIYPPARMKELNASQLARHFTPCGDDYQVRTELRRLVLFDFHNLKHDNGLSDLDAIFCRNVMIYFDEQEQRRLIEKFHRALRPDGYLLIGHAETAQGLSNGFRFIFEDRGTAYQRI